MRIKNEHPDDSNCIMNDRVKGRLKVTRAFGAGFLKQVCFCLISVCHNAFLVLSLRQYADVSVDCWSFILHPFYWMAFVFYRGK